MSDIGDTIGGRYRLQRLLGAGGMGSVYLAEHVHLRRSTAIKLLRPDFGVDPDAEARFRREAMLAARISHPRIAQVYDFDRTPAGQFFLAMEFVEGETVAQRLRRAGPFPIAQVVRILSALAEGLDHAHGFGILHRDIKPENVMLGPGGIIKILDFGVARGLESGSITSGGVLVGTPTYMSPEQLLGEPLGPTSDIYSLGLVIYEMIAGRLPHTGVTAEELRVQRVMQPPAPLFEVCAECPHGLWEVVGRAVAVEPAARWPTAEAFAEAAAQVVAQPHSSLVSTGRVVAPTERPVDRWEGYFEALRFAGRDRDVREVRDAWAAARADRTTVLWIEGDEGAGKSAFFELARREAADDGAAQLVGRGYEADFARSYAGWTGVLRRALELRAARERSWPAIAALTDAFEGTPVPDRPILFDEVAALLRGAARYGPVFVGIEDLHSADPASLSLLEFLAAELQDLPILLAVTVDPHSGSQETRVRDVREQVGRVSHQVRIRLHPLGAEAVAAWLSHALGREAPSVLAQFVYGYTEGNALFIEQVVRSLIDRGDFERLTDEQVLVALADMPAPEAVADVVRRRLERMSEAAREVLQIAAVAGRTFDVDLLLLLSDSDEDAVLDALDEAVGAAVLSPMDRTAAPPGQGTPGDWYRFTHGKIAQVLAQGLNPRRRRRLHGRIAETLAARPGVQPEALAWHWYHAGHLDRAADAACTASRRALAVDDGENALTFAVLAAEAAQTADAKREAHAQRGDALRRLDRHAEAAAAYARARLTAGADDPTAAVLRAKELRCAIKAHAAKPVAVVPEARGLITATASSGVGYRAVAELLLAEALLASGTTEDAPAAARAALTTCRGTNDPRLVGEALLVRGEVELRRGDRGTAARMAEEAEAIYGEIRDLHGGLQATLLRSAVAASSGDRAAAIATLDAALPLVERARVTALVQQLKERRAALEATV